MVTHIVRDETDYNTGNKVTEDHFGVNLVTIYDEEYVDPSSNLSSLVEEMGITNLRYPGGAATEYYFDMANPNADLSTTQRVQDLLPMDEMFEQAGKSELSVSIVIPTRTGFEKSAAKAMRDGSYGSREEISDEYLNDLETFLEAVVRESSANGVRISAIELGNEFWGSGEMTASEYGYLVANLLPVIANFYERNDLKAPDLVVQGTSSASAVYSPREDTIVYIDPEKDMYGIYSQDYIEKEFDGEVPKGFITTQVDGQGSAYYQVRDLVEQINRVPESADLVDGVLQHYYVSTGLDAVDEENAFMFSQYDRFVDLLDRSDSMDPVSFHVTEWNSNYYGENARGLEHASMLVEMFYEQITHGIDVSQIWPLTFDTTQSITLTDVEQENLTIAGETFSQMRDRLVGKSPVLDWSLESEVDVHGFGNDDEFSFIASDRGGETRDSFKLDFSEIVGDDLYFIKSTMLTDGGKGGADHRADPVVINGESSTSDDGTVVISLDPWALNFIEFTRIGDGDDHIDGSDSKDVIYGRAGDDYFDGNSAADRLFGEEGNDTINGGVGRDYLHGGKGRDVLQGGAGKDKIVGGAGNDTVMGGAWHDTIMGEGGKDRLEGGNGRDLIYGGRRSDTISGGTWDDTLDGGAGRDNILGGKGRDKIDGGVGGDLLDGGESNDTIDGGRGSDYINGGEGSDKIYDGSGRDTVFGGEGADHFVFTSDGKQDVLGDFEVGLDLLDLRAWGSNHVSSLKFDKVAVDGEITTTISTDDERLVLSGVSVDEILSLVEGETLLL